MAANILLLGHRGTRARTVKENTFAAFDQALEHGCDGFEFDLRLTGCGRALVCHGSKAERVTVSRARRDQLSAYPRLEDVLIRYRKKGFLDIEIKVNGLESKVLTALRDRQPERNYVVSSFLPEVLLELKARRAEISTGIICETSSQLMRWRKLPVDYVITHKSLVNRKLIQTIHDSRLKVFVWTVNDKKSMLRFAEWGVDGIISDNTGLLCQVFERRSLPKAQQTIN